MMLVIMTRSLIRLGNTVRTRLDSNCITNSYDDRRGRARTESDRNSHTNMTETDSDITRGYNAGTRDYGSITRSYRREREGVGTNTNNDDITRGYN